MDGSRVAALVAQTSAAQAPAAAAQDTQARRDVLRQIWCAAMQPIDPDDPRKTYIKIAASIRAAILSGEFQPGTQLPIGKDLAKFFGVTRATIGSAIRVLQDEGFVRGLTGSGVYVNSRARIPVADGEPHPLHGVAAFLHEAGHLKNLPRAGWLLLGIRHPESVAEHSFRVGMVGIVLAVMEGADIGRTAALCLMHDAHETRIGDVPSVGRAYVRTDLPQVVTSHQTSGMPEAIIAALSGLTAEYEDEDMTLECRVAHDADKLETLLQAQEYAAQGYATEPWADTSIEALRTESGKQLAQAIVAGHPHDWWTTFASTYHELRAATRARQRDTGRAP